MRRQKQSRMILPTLALCSSVVAVTAAEPVSPHHYGDLHYGATDASSERRHKMQLHQRAMERQNRIAPPSSSKRVLLKGQTTESVWDYDELDYENDDNYEDDNDYRQRNPEQLNDASSRQLERNGHPAGINKKKKEMLTSSSSSTSTTVDKLFDNDSGGDSSNRQRGGHPAGINKKSNPASTSNEADDEGGSEGVGESTLQTRVKTTKRTRRGKGKKKTSTTKKKGNNKKKKKKKNGGTTTKKKGNKNGNKKGKKKYGDNGSSSSNKMSGNISYSTNTWCPPCPAPAPGHGGGGYGSGGTMSSYSSKLDRSDNSGGNARGGDPSNPILSGGKAGARNSDSTTSADDGNHNHRDLYGWNSWGGAPYDWKSGGWGIGTSSYGWQGGGGWWHPPSPPATVCICETPAPTYTPTYTPTYFPTDQPVKYIIVTREPTVSPSLSPSLSPITEVPTVSPTKYIQECNWFYWGGDEGRGAVVGVDTELPDPQPDEVIDVSAGSRHTFKLNKNGTATVSGFIESFDGYKGHMGISRTLLNEGANPFIKVKNVVNSDGDVVPSPKFMKVFAGAGAPGDSRDMHSVLIDTRGNVYTTGNNNKGQLCLGDYESRDTFHQVSGLPFQAVSAAVGLDFTLILLADGKVFGCGSNENGELGLGQLNGTTVPDQAYGLANITEVSAGLSFSLYLSRTGHVFGSGSNLFGQMCESTEGDTLDIPKKLVVTNVTSIETGHESSYFLLNSGKVKSCGRNDEGQLGDGTFKDSTEPVNVDLPHGIKVQRIGSGASSKSVFFIADGDVVFGAGQNYRFQLGIGEDEVQPSPVLVQIGDEADFFDITKISSSGTHTVAITCLIPSESPTVYPTAYPTFNPTNFPTVEPTLFPTGTPTVEPTQNPTDEPTVPPTFNPTLNPTVSTLEPTFSPTDSPTIVTDEPTISPTISPTLSPTLSPTFSPTESAFRWFFWGAEEGRGGSLDQNQPVPEEINEDIRDLSAGSRHTFLIDANGKVSAAGFIESKDSYYGHLGLGKVQDCQGDNTQLCVGTNVFLPVSQVVNAAGEMVTAPPFAKVYAGMGPQSDSGPMHSLIISEGGKAYVSGSNSQGQLCLGDLGTTSVDMFTEVNGFDNVILGAVGAEFTLLLTADGKVYGCGSNDVGQIGQPPQTRSSSGPVLIKELNGITGLSAGQSFSLFINANEGTVWGSGSNLFIQQCEFTDGNPLLTPKIISGLGPGKIVAVTASKESSFFLFDDGSAQSCGRNDEGQLGDGTFIKSSAEAPISDVVFDDPDFIIERIGSGPSSQSVFFIGKDSVYATGFNERYQLGIDEVASQSTPTKVLFSGPVDIEFVSSSGSHTVANGILL